MMGMSSADQAGMMDFDLTPLGERRRRLPLQRKVKQLQRPWQHADDTAREVPHRLIWATSQHKKEGPRCAVRPRSGAPALYSATGSNSCNFGSSSRGRPSTGVPMSPSWQRNKLNRTRDNRPPFFRHSSSPELTTTPVRRRGGGASPAASPQNSNNALAAMSRLRTSGGWSTDHPERGVEIAERQSLDATLHSSVSGPSFLGSLLDDTTAPDTETATPQPQQSDSWQRPADVKTERRHFVVPTTTASSRVFEGAHGDAFASSRYQDSRLPRRPASAGVLPVEQTPARMLIIFGDKIARPQTAGSARNSTSTNAPHHNGSSGGGGQRCDTRARSAPLARPQTAGGGGASAASTDEECEAGSSLGGRVSVAVMLPLLEEAKGTTMMRFRPGSSVSSRKAATAPDPEEAGDMARVNKIIEETGGTWGLDQGRQRANETPEKSTSNGGGNMFQTRAPPIGVLGYFVGEDPGVGRQTSTSLHGRALASNRSRPSSSKRPLPPALVPGEQLYGTSHPLSPTNMGSPPRRHRNSNWGEEGERLDLEEQENSRQTVPFVVTGTMLGWKISTRGRKKSLEDSLKSADYSDHALIPVYGFQCVDDPEAAGLEERRKELCRLEARALAAERTALERRSRAEGGAGGAAFARAMSRRALARADWIQKMGDVLDVRQENVCRGSSPENVSAYRKRVRDRVQGELLRRRTVRGLPSRRPPRIRAVTSRADLSGAKKPPHEKSGRQVGAATESGGLVQEAAEEPYLMLVRARQRRGTRCGSDIGVVPFCAECLGTCSGACSPGGQSYGSSSVVGRPEISADHREAPSVVVPAVETTYVR